MNANLPCTCPRIDGYRLKRSTCPRHREADAAAHSVKVRAEVAAATAQAGPDHEPWIHTETRSVSILQESTPGIYHVSRELMHQMMRELGYVPAQELE